MKHITPRNRHDTALQSGDMVTRGHPDATLSDFLRVSEYQGPFLLRQSAPEGAALTAETCYIDGVEYIAACVSWRGLERRAWGYVGPYKVDRYGPVDARRVALGTAAGLLAQALHEATERTTSPTPAPVY